LIFCVKILVDIFISAANFSLKILRFFLFLMANPNIQHALIFEEFTVVKIL